MGVLFAFGFGLVLWVGKKIASACLIEPLGTLCVRMTCFLRLVRANLLQPVHLIGGRAGEVFVPVDGTPGLMSLIFTGGIFGLFGSWVVGAFSVPLLLGSGFLELSFSIDVVG